MKLTKSLFLAFAGLGLFACSNEDVTTENGIPSGKGAVTVQLVNPGVSTRTVQDPTTGNNTVAITGNIVVKLYEKANLGTASQTITIPATSVETNTVLKFWNVTEPGKITVSINNGQSSYAGVGIATLNGQDILPANIPAYGETTKFILTDETGSPIINNDNDNNDPERPGNKQEQGASEGDQNKVYQLYNAKVTMAIPVARLEVSGITHKSHPQGGQQDKCEYKKLTIKGVYMDNLYTKGGAYQENNTQVGEDGFYKSVFANGTELVDYCWKKKVDDDDLYLGTGEDAILKDEITAGDAVGENFLEAGATWPKPALEGDPETSKAKVFAYNFYPASNVAEGDNNLPKFKIYFDSSESLDATKPLPAPRYAMITKYKTEGGTEIKSFVPGTIYRITSAELKDGNIIGDEGGNTLYGVEVTVKEAVWTPVNIKADWAE